MESFLETLANKYSTLGKSLEQYVFVLPSKRAGVFLRDQFKQKIGQAIFAPKITSIESWVCEISGLSYATNTEQLFVLYKAYENHSDKDRDSFSDFCSWGNILLQDFSEIDRYLVEADQLFDYIHNLQEINHWGDSTTTSEVISNYLKFWASLYPMYQEFTAALLSTQRGNQGLVYRKAVEEVDSYIESNTNKTFVFIGFNALNKAEEKLIQAFLDSSVGKIHWDIDSYLLNDSVHEAGTFIRGYEKEWPYLKRNGLDGVSNHLAVPKKIEIIGVPKNVAQAEITGAILEKMDPSQQRKTAVILSDEPSVNLVLNALPKSLERVNITMGFPMQQSQMASWVSTLFELHSANSSDSYYIEYLIGFLSHPFTEYVYPSKEGGALGLSQRLRKSNRSYWSLKSIIEFDPLGQDLFNILLTNEAKKPHGFIQLVRSLLVLLGKKAEELKFLSIQSDSCYFLELMDRLLEWVKAYPFINSIHAVKQLYDESISSMHQYYQGEPLEGLQIMGMLESRNLDYQTVLITQVNEGILPGGKTPSTLIPFELKKRYGMPTYKERDAVFAYHFYRIIQRAKNVFLLFNTEADALGSGEQSRFIRQLESDPILRKYCRRTIAAPKVPILEKSLLEIDKSPGDIDKIYAIAKEKLSPSALLTYIRNPIDYYRRYILRIKEDRPWSSEMASNVFGTIVHESLDELYRDFLGKQLTKDALENTLKKVKNTVADKFLEHFVAPDLARGKNAIAYKVMIHYVELCIKNDIEDCEKHAIEILELECEYRVPYQLPNGKGTITLMGKIDRVERRDGVVGLIDYKTGNAKATQLVLKDWETLTQEYDHAKKFQLLFYALLYSHEHPQEKLQAGIYSFKNLKGGTLYFKHGEKGKDSIITPEIIQEFKGYLDALINELLDPEVPFVEKVIEEKKRW